jgi:uncharacterized membrane protein
MIDAGVPITPAQAGGKIAKQIEASLYSVPFNRPLKNALARASNEASDLGEVWQANRLSDELTDYLICIGLD